MLLLFTTLLSKAFEAMAALEPRLAGFLPGLEDRLRTIRDKVDWPSVSIEVATGLIVGAAIYLTLTLVLRVTRKHLEKKEATRFGRIVSGVGQVVSATAPLFIFVVALTAASEVMTLPAKAHEFVRGLFIIAFFLQAAAWANVAANGWLSDYTSRRASVDPSMLGAAQIIGVITRTAIWSLALLLMLDNLGINITTLIAGFGIGGIAIGLAAQNILGDLFASLSILLDKPFVVGDFIVSGDYQGTVERIGLKSTRIRSLSGEQAVISNHDLLASRIRNYKRMAERRVVFILRVTYDTSKDKLERIPTIIREAVERQQKVRFDRSHFAAFGEYALTFETAYWVLSSDYTLYMDIQQAISFEIFERFQAESIPFAFPGRPLVSMVPTFAPGASTPLSAAPDGVAGADGRAAVTPREPAQPRASTPGS